jgi:hypothetical protein
MHKRIHFALDTAANDIAALVRSFLHAATRLPQK